MSALPPKSVSPLPGLHLRGMGRPLPLDQIVRFEADDNYTLIHLRGQARPLLYSYTLGVMCQRFPFMARLAKSQAVNPQYVQTTPSPRWLLCDQRPLRLSRYYRQRAAAELAVVAREPQRAFNQGYPRRVAW